MKEVNEFNDEYNDEFIDEFEIVDKGDEFRFVPTEQEVMAFTQMVSPLRLLFEDDAEPLLAQSMKVTEAAIDRKKNTPISKVFDKINKESSKLMKQIDKAIKEDKNDKYSYLHRAKIGLRKHLEMQLSGDFKLIQEHDPFDADIYIKIMNDFPQPRFAEDKDKEWKKDTERYEAYMRNHPFMEAYEERYRYYEENLIPYLKDKKSGRVNEDKERDFKKATYEHLLKEKKYVEEIMKFDQDPETQKIGPFAKAQNANTKMRFGENALKSINSELDALKRGWSPDDFKMLRDLDNIMNKLDKKKDNIPNYESVSIKYGIFKNLYISNKKERKEALDSIKPIYETYKKYGGPSKDTEPFIKEFEKQHKAETSVVLLDRSDRLRSKMLNDLQRFMKGLNTGHRVGTHTDKAEMVELKNKTHEVIELLMSNRADIYESQEFKEAFHDLGVKADNYLRAKRASYEREVNEKYVDEELRTTNPQEYHKQVRKAKDLVKAWRPKTKMGETRYNTTLEMFDICSQYEKLLKTEQNPERVSKEQEIKNLGYDIIHQDELDYFGTRPYDSGLAKTMNFYKKNPAYIPEMDENKTATFEEFKDNCTKIECDGISEDDFAILALTAAHNPSIFDHEKLNDIWNLKAKEELGITMTDKIRQVRTMYSLDIGKSGDARANFLRDFGNDLINVARYKAKDVFEEYKRGNKTPLIDMLATGIKELNGDITSIPAMDGRKGDFARSTELLSKMLEFARKDKDVIKAVTNKIGQEEMENVNDNLRLKGMLDKAVDSERKLELAVKNKKPLTKAEKQECIDNIVTYDYLEVFYNKCRTETEAQNKELNEFNKFYDKTDVEIVMNVRQDITKEDLNTKQDVLGRKARKPVYQLTKRLRTDKGMKDFKELTKLVSDGITPSMTESQILKSTKNLSEKRVNDIREQKAKKMEEIRKKNRELQEKERQQGMGKPKLPTA